MPVSVSVHIAISCVWVLGNILGDGLKIPGNILNAILERGGGGGGREREGEREREREREREYNDEDPDDDNNDDNNNNSEK